MKLTARLKQWLVQNWSIKAGSDDSTFRKAAGDALAAGEDEGGLSTEMLVDLTSTKSTQEAEDFSTMIKSLSSAISDLTDIMPDDDDDDDGAFGS